MFLRFFLQDFFELKFYVNEPMMTRNSKNEVSLCITEIQPQLCRIDLKFSQKDKNIFIYYTLHDYFMMKSKLRYTSKWTIFLFEIKMFAFDEVRIVVQ